MQKLKKIYRDSYGGENVVTSLTYTDTEWVAVTDYVPNAVFNTHSTAQAIAIGNGESRSTFDLQHIANHKAGLGGADRLQSYGCNALYRDFAPDFLIVVGEEIAKEVALSDYPSTNLVYAHGEHVIEYPGKFYLIPQNISYDAGAIAAYMACFDGHKKVFLMGYDGYEKVSAVNNIYKDTNGYPVTGTEQNQAFWTKSLKVVMTTYDDVEFIRVMPMSSYWCPPDWESLPNFRQIGFRDFVLEADIG